MGWHWPVCCCLLWAALAATAAWHQLGLLENLEDPEAWPCGFGDGDKSPKADIDGCDSPLSHFRDSRVEEGQPLMSTLPSGVTAHGSVMPETQDNGIGSSFTSWISRRVLKLRGFGP